jgi:hypothetical protein
MYEYLLIYSHFTVGGPMTGNYHRLQPVYCMYIVQTVRMLSRLFFHPIESTTIHMTKDFIHSQSP